MRDPRAGSLSLARITRPRDAPPIGAGGVCAERALSLCSETMKAITRVLLNCCRHPACLAGALLLTSGGSLPAVDEAALQRLSAAHAGAAFRDPGVSVAGRCRAGAAIHQLVAVTCDDPS